MKTFNQYESPEIRFTEFNSEGMLCLSNQADYNATLDDYTVNTETYW